MIVPPWNLFWWGVGGIAYALSGGKKNDPSGDGALGMVVMAPISLPMLIATWPSEMLKRRAWEKKQELREEAVQRIVQDLTAAGIAIERDRGGPAPGVTGLWIRAKPEGAIQERAFQLAFADAVRAYQGKLTAQEVCADAEPLELLNRRWADANRIDACAEPISTGPCVDCGGNPYVQWVFGKEMQEWVRNFLTNKAERYTLKDKTHRDVYGHICGECSRKMGWTMASSIPRQWNPDTGAYGDPID
ncbi:MAG: hypothetical protein RLZZ324_1186 [Candidatus Parcubacteria bacterium]|jgi:hypothetical protein